MQILMGTGSRAFEEDGVVNGNNDGCSNGLPQWRYRRLISQEQWVSKLHGEGIAMVIIFGKVALATWGIILWLLFTNRRREKGTSLTRERNARRI